MNDLNYSEAHKNLIASVRSRKIISEIQEKFNVLLLEEFISSKGSHFAEKICKIQIQISKLKAKIMSGQ